MRISRSNESKGRPLSTADLAATGQRADAGTKIVGHGPEDSHAMSDDVMSGKERLMQTTSAERPAHTGDESSRVTQKSESTERMSGRPAADVPRTPQGDADMAAHRTDRPHASEKRSGEEAPMALFTPELTETYRSSWVSIQSSFVDDPKQAVRSGDELVAQVMTTLANTFADERHKVEAQLDETGEGSTENLRVAFRRYRSFFDRLLSL